MLAWDSFFSATTSLPICEISLDQRDAKQWGWQWTIDHFFLIVYEGWSSWRSHGSSYCYKHLRSGHVDMMRVRFFSMAKTDSNTSHHHIMLSRTGKNVSAICGVVGGVPIPNFFLCTKCWKAAAAGCQRFPWRATRAAVTCLRLIFRDMIFVVQDQVCSIDLQKNTMAWNVSVSKQDFGEQWRWMSYLKGHHFRTFPEWPGIECAWVDCEIPRTMRKVGLLLILTGTTPDLTADLELSPLDRDPEKGVVDGCVAGCFKLWSIQAFSSNIIPWFVRHDDASFGSQGRSDSISHHSASRKK